MAKVSSEQIVAAARELFRDRGFAGSSMQDLADMVGIRKASLYSRFPDKEALIKEVLDLTLGELFPAAPETETEWLPQYRTALGRIAGHLQAHGRCVGLHLAYGLEGDGQRANPQVERFFTECRVRLAAILRLGLDSDLAEEMALDSILRIEGTTLWLALHGDAAPMDKAIAALYAQAEAMSQDVPDPDARRVLTALVGDWRRASKAEKQLAARLADAEGRVLFVEQALRGQIEAASCFL